MNLKAKVEPSGQPEPPKKPTGSKQQVGRITIELNGQTKTLNVYWYGENVSPYDERMPTNIQELKKLAKNLFEQMKQNPKIKNPIQTEVEVEYLNNWYSEKEQEERDFKLLSAKFVAKENVPVQKEPLPKIEKETETFKKVSNLVQEILYKSGSFKFEKKIKTGEGIEIKEEEKEEPHLGAVAKEEKEEEKAREAIGRTSLDFGVKETNKIFGFNKEK